MLPTHTSSDQINQYLTSGHWSRETMVRRYRVYAKENPAGTACSDGIESFTWAELENLTNVFATNLLSLGLEKDSTALVQIPSSCKEIILRLALKKAGIIAAFVPFQWKTNELHYVSEKISPRLVVLENPPRQPKDTPWLWNLLNQPDKQPHCITVANTSTSGWINWAKMLNKAQETINLEALKAREFSFNEVSLITASSGTSGYAKLCEWVEAAQVCTAHAQNEKLQLTEDDRVGVFAPMSGAAGLIVWTISAAIPCSYFFPASFRTEELLRIIERQRITFATTVPVLLSRLAREDLSKYNLRSLRALRVGTAATDISAAQSFEQKTGCKVVIAGGSMEVPGFAHAHINEPQSTRLDGSVGLPLRGGKLRIENDVGELVKPGTEGELKIAAPYASSGYWNDPKETKISWSGQWYSTGDMGLITKEGRLTLLGRKKEIINRSGLKILPGELEGEICEHPSVFDCAVIAASHREYGEVPWAFIQLSKGFSLDANSITEPLIEKGLPTYKIPERFIQILELPRINDNKVDKPALQKIMRGQTKINQEN